MNLKITLTLILVTLLVGCSAVKQAAQPTPVDLTGDWQITLSESQPAAFGVTGDNPTVIALSLTQTGSVLTSTEAWVHNPACGNLKGTWFEVSDVPNGWEIKDLSNFTGIQTAQALSFTILESAGGVPPSGTLAFTGNVNTDGTLSGVVNDACTGQNAVTFTAARLSTFPVQP